MDIRQSLDLLATCARKVMSIEQLGQYNEAVDKLVKFINEHDTPAEPVIPAEIETKS